MKAMILKGVSSFAQCPAPLVAGGGDADYFELITLLVIRDTVCPADHHS
jgi:hypothetical protein